jgi:tetratricopeptide (TPR) repeat protein
MRETLTAGVATNPESRWRWWLARWWFIPSLLLACTALSYLPLLHAGYVWDDDAFVYKNPVLTEPSGLYKIWLVIGGTAQYYPLTYSTFWLEYHVWGFAPVPSHIINIALHALNAILLWLLLRRLRTPGAAIAALLFALHPVEVESVAWITERKNVLSGAMYLLAALAYDRFDPLSGKQAGRRRWNFYAVSFAFYLLALSAKSVTFSLPVALLAVMVWRRDRLVWRDILPLAPMLVIGLCAGVLTSYMERHFIHAEGAEWSLSALQRVLIAGRVPWFYLSKLLLPVRLTFFYPRWHVHPGAAWQWLFPVSTATFITSLWMLRGAIGRGAFAAVFYFGVTLFPALGFVNVFPFRYSFVADHFQYLASIGPLTLIAAGGALLASRWKWSALVEGGVATVVIAVLGLATALQCGEYFDEEALYRATLARNPGAWIAAANLSVMRLASGHAAEALKLADQAVELRPEDADSYLNRGNALAGLSEMPLARAAYERAVELDPQSAKAWSDLGNANLTLNLLADAEADYRRALSIDPDYAEAHNNLGSLLRRRGRNADAAKEYERALQLEPDYAQAMQNLAETYLALGRPDDAIVQYEALVHLTGRPEIHGIIGDLQREQGRLHSAAQEYLLAIAAAPNDALAWLHLAEVVAAQGNLTEARGDALRAAALSPQSVEAHRVLAQILSGLGDSKGALGEYNKALRLNQNDLGTLNSIAWLLATSSDVHVQNADLALQIAQKVCTMTPSSNANFFDTLAAAYAAGGNFSAASQWAAIAEDKAKNDPALSHQIAQHAAAYANRQPWREPTTQPY